MFLIYHDQLLTEASIIPVRICATFITLNWLEFGYFTTDFKFDYESKLKNKQMAASCDNNYGMLKMIELN